MVNHFASLLANIDPLLNKPPEEGFVLSTDDGFFIIVTQTGEEILLSGYGGVPVSNPYSLFVNKRYVPIILPAELESFRSLLFHANASDFYNQLLLYFYLRIVETSDRAVDVLRYDKRLTYNINEIDEYFKFTRVSAPKTNNTAFRILINGKLIQNTSVNAFSSIFKISQYQNTNSLYIFSPTQKKYYKADTTPSNSSEGMLIPIELENNQTNITKAIAIGDTGLSFRLTGAFQEPINFTSTSNKFWEFTAEAPANIDFFAKLKQLEGNPNILTDMLAYNRDKCSINYENMWHSHHNSIYRLAGLLLAYVERVNLVWENIAT